MNPDDVPYLEAVSAEIVLPREAMGLGDVKFMAAIGAFIGWQGVVFSLMVSSMIGAVVGVALIILRRREWSSRMPYGPYIALAAGDLDFWRQENRPRNFRHVIVAQASPPAGCGGVPAASSGNTHRDGA